MMDWKGLAWRLGDLFGGQCHRPGEVRTWRRGTWLDIEGHRGERVRMRLAWMTRWWRCYKGRVKTSASWLYF